MDIVEIAEARDAGGRVRVVAAAQKLDHGQFLGREFLVIPVGLQFLIGLLGDRHVTGLLVPVFLDLDRGQGIEERDHAFIFLIGEAFEHIKRGAADGGVYRSRAGLVGQVRGGPVELVAFHRGVAGGGADVEQAVTGLEVLQRPATPVGLGFCAEFGEPFIEPAFQAGHVLEGPAVLIVEHQPRTKPVHAVILAGIELLLLGHRVFHIGPHAGIESIAAGLAAARNLDTGGLQRADLRFHVVIGLRQVGQPGRVEQILVHIKDRRRAVEGHAEQLVVRIGIGVHHRRQIVVLVERDTMFGHHFFRRDDRAREHQGDHPGLVVLEEVRLLVRPDGGDGLSQQMAVAAFPGGDHFILVLAFVEALDDLVHALAEAAAHGVPPVDLDRLGGRIRGAEGNGRGQQAGEPEFIPLHDSISLKSCGHENAPK